MFSRFFKKQPPQPPVPAPHAPQAAREPVDAYAKINMRLMPDQRGGLFEDPLHDALVKNGLGEVTGGGTATTPTGEISYCGIDLALNPDRLEEAVVFACDFLNRSGAALGSELIFTSAGKKFTADFGVAHGLAVTFDLAALPPGGSDNPQTQAAIDALSATLDTPQGGRAMLLSQLQSPREILLAYYGHSAEHMLAAANTFITTHPLGRAARASMLTPPAAS